MLNPQPKLLQRLPMDGIEDMSSQNQIASTQTVLVAAIRRDCTGSKASRECMRGKLALANRGAHDSGPLPVFASLHIDGPAGAEPNITHNVHVAVSAGSRNRTEKFHTAVSILRLADMQFAQAHSFDNFVCEKSAYYLFLRFYATPHCTDDGRPPCMFYMADDIPPEHQRDNSCCERNPQYFSLDRNDCIPLPCSIVPYFQEAFQ